MQHVIRINAIEARAQTYRLSLTGLCRRAGVQPSTVLRWRSGTMDPGILLFEEVAKKLETALEAARAELAASLREPAA